MDFSDILTVGYPFSKLYKLIPLELMVRCPKDPQNNTDHSHSLDCPPELDGKPSH